MNYEYGVGVNDSFAVARIRSDVLDYSGLGALVSRQSLLEYCQIAERVSKVLSESDGCHRKACPRRVSRPLRSWRRPRLIRLRLAKGPLPSIFSKAISFFLKRDGPLKTTQIHVRIENTYPDLCNNAVDRVIDGMRFGKKWKTRCRTVEQHLKQKGLVEYVNGGWRLTTQ